MFDYFWRNYLFEEYQPFSKSEIRDISIHRFFLFRNFQCDNSFFMSLRPNAVKIERQTPWVMFFLLFENKKQTSFIHSWIWWFLWFFFALSLFAVSRSLAVGEKPDFLWFRFRFVFFWFFNNSILTARGYPFLIDSNLELIAEILFFFLATASRFVFFFGSPFSLRKSFVSFWSESLFTRRPLRRRCFLEGFLAVWRFKENNGPDWPLRFIFLNKNGAGGPVRSNTFPFGDLRTVSFFLGGGGREIDFYRVFSKIFNR